jgi:hypothetical protein
MLYCGKGNKWSVFCNDDPTAGKAMAKMNCTVLDKMYETNPERDNILTKNLYTFKVMKSLISQ